MTLKTKSRAHPETGPTGGGTGRLTETPRATARALPIALLRAREAVMWRFRPLVASSGLTDQQWRVLRVLNEYGPLDPTQIAAHAGILKPSLSRMLQSLEEDSYVTRRNHPGDKRSTIISITAKAERILQRLAPHSNAIYEEIERVYGEKKMRQLLDLLEDLAELDDR